MGAGPQSQMMGKKNIDMTGTPLPPPTTPSVIDQMNPMLNQSLTGGPMNPQTPMPQMPDETGGYPQPPVMPPPVMPQPYQNPMPTMPDETGGFPQVPRPPIMGRPNPQRPMIRPPMPQRPMQPQMPRRPMPIAPRPQAPSPVVPPRTTGAMAPPNNFTMRQVLGGQFNPAYPR